MQQEEKMLIRPIALDDVENFYHMMCRLDEWAGKNGIVRLELTVECVNTGAKLLYEKHGFKVEGIRPKSMKVNGRFVDEYYMGKILD